MACKVIYNKETNEINEVLAPNGKESMLFNSILELPNINNDKAVAVRQWATVYLDDFKSKFGDWETNPSEFKGELDENGEPNISNITIEETTIEDIPPKSTGEVVKELINNASFIKLTKDQKQYVNSKTGKKYDRVTSFLNDFKEVKPSPILTSSQIIGTKVDELTRDYFGGKLKSLESYDVSSTSELSDYLKALKVLKKQFDAVGETVLANDIVLYNDDLGLAGTVDLLTYDKRGDFRIYDMKTMRGNNFNEFYRNDDKNKYDTTRFGKSKRQKHNEQLSLYRILLNNTHGVKAVKTAIIPIVIKYEPGDVVTSKLEKLPTLLTQTVDNVNGATLKTFRKLKYIEGDGDDIFRKEEGLKKTLFIENISEVESKDFKVAELSNIENRVDRVYDKIRDNLDYQLKILQSAETSTGKNSAHSDQVKNIINTLDKFSDTNRIKGVLNYVKSINKEINTVKKSLTKRSVDGENMVQVLENYKRYISLFSSINDISILYKDAVAIGEIKGYDNIEKSIEAVKSTHDSIEREITALTRKYMAENLNDIKYHRKVEAKWRDRLAGEYNDIYGIPSGKNENQRKKDWVNNKLVQFRSEIQAEVDKATKDLVYNNAFDITVFAEQFLSSLETNSDIVQVVQTVLSEIRDNIIEELTPVEDDLLKLFDEFKKSTGGKYNPNAAFKNILDRDGNGNLYLKSKYKASFITKHNEMQEVYADRNALASDIKNGLSKDSVKLKELTLKAKSLYSNLYYKKGKNTLIHKEWHTDLSSVSDMDKKVLNAFKEITDKSSGNTFGINSLTKKIGFAEDSYFYKLPSITKSDLERLQSGSAKGLINDKIKELKERRPDDIGYESVKATADGRILREVPIHFRGMLDSKDQSVDLFTMYKLEAHNGIAFKHRKNKEMFLEMIIDVATNKGYYQTKGLSFTPLQNLFAKRNKDLLHEDNTTKRTVSKLKGILDSQLYDINKLYAGKIGKYDAQKLVSFINGYTGMLGMSLNYHSALVNLTGGYAQFLIHAMAKDVINVKNIKNALSKYSLDTPANFKDFNSAANKSFSNQINIAFDTFGGLGIGTDSFLKDKAWKKLANVHGLTALHQLGEHQLQSIIAMAVLDSVKALDKDGKTVSNKSMLDLLSLDDKGKLSLDEAVKYNEHSPLTEWTKGGRVEMQQLIKYKIQKTLGNYDSNYQGEIMKTPAGRLILMYRRFFIPLALDRFRGANKAFTDKENIKEHEKFFSHATKQYEEGSYVTATRFLVKNIAPALLNLKLRIITQDWNKMTDHERSNIRKTITEFGTMVMLGILAGMVAQAADDDDDELLYFMAYTMRRMESELAQFSNPKEAFRITKSPFASLRTIENMFEITGNLVDFTTWGEKYKSGKRRGELKIKRNIEKMIPVVNKMSRQNEEMYNYLESAFLGM